MPQLKASDHYIWKTTDVLGRGATGEVYKARNKNTGEVFAVKTFNHMGRMRPLGVQTRELDVLRKLSHENIVHLLDIEEERDTHTKVIVMEMCTGGSVYTILDEPQNAFGMEEEEFLRVLNDVAAGMQHIRQQGIVHRDIKPGNIMRSITEDGRSVYKLTDFGAARELEDEEQFMSLYGTEEYLHPDMYERAVMRINAQKQFKATVDLWSIGVTFYHIATGQLPFRPFGGRKNKEKMYEITTKKESGVISGVQHSENGDIEWSRTLPVTCRLSQGLKNQVTLMLASLLDNDESNMWGFDKFFQEVELLVSKKVIYVFHVCSLSILNIYIPPNANYASLQELIASQTDIRASQQMLLFENTHLSDTVRPSQTVDTYPPTSPQNPVYLFTSDTMEVPFINEPLVANFPKISSTVSVDTDYSLAKQCCGIVHAISEKIAQYIQNHQLQEKGIKMLLSVFRLEVNHLQDYTIFTSDRFTETNKRFEFLINMHPAYMRVCSLICRTKNGTCLEACEMLAKLVSKLQDNHRNITSMIEEAKDSVKQFSDEATNSRCGDAPHNVALLTELKRRKGQMSLLISHVNEILEEFRKNKSQRKLPYNDEQIHKFEKVRLQEICTKAWSIYEDSTKQMKELKNEVGVWFRNLCNLRRRHRMLEGELGNVIEQHTDLCKQLDNTQLEYRKRGEEFLKNVEKEGVEREGIPRRLSGQRSQDKKRQLMNSLQEDLESLASDTMELRQAMQQNQELLTRIKLLNDPDENSDEFVFLEGPKDGST